MYPNLSSFYTEVFHRLFYQEKYPSFATLKRCTLATAAMPASQGNLTGTSDPKAVPHGHWDSFPEEPFPLYDGTKSIIYRSEDGKVAVGMLREKGKDTLVWPVDEFLFVTEGSIDIDVHGGEKFTLGKGDVMVMKKGQTITFECSEDFANVAVFIDLQEKVTLV